jgi:hypothetical protein
MDGRSTQFDAWKKQLNGRQPLHADSSSTPGSRYDLAMEGAFDMAIAGTIASFTLQGFSYLKTPGGNQGKHDLLLDLAACYSTSTVSLIVMMVCAMLLRLLPDGMTFSS